MLAELRKCKESWKLPYESGQWIKSLPEKAQWVWQLRFRVRLQSRDGEYQSLESISETPAKRSKGSIHEYHRQIDVRKNKMGRRR